MSRIASVFARLRAQNEAALVGFVTCGDPFPAETADLVVTLANAGADIMEIGIPFSDPLMDGPTIQASTQRALENGMTPPRVLDVVREVRAKSEVPIVLMGAFNPVLQYGMERFARDAAEAGVDGAILTDLTPDEAGEWKQIADGCGLDTIFLLAPTSTPGRMDAVAEMASGFIYCMSRSGVTGARADVPVELQSLLEAIHTRAGGTPVCVGFGVATPEHVAAISRYAEGVVIGAALIDKMHKAQQNGADKATFLELATDFMRPLKAATRRGA